MLRRAEYPGTGELLGLVAGLALAASSPACGKGPGGDAKRIPRDKDAAAVVMVDSPQTAKVTFSDEKEPNDQLVQAMILAPGTGVRGTLASPADVDLYAVNVPRDGFLVASVSGVEDADLILELRDFRDNPIVRSDRGPATITEGFPNYPVEQGTYHLAVLEFVKKRRGRRDPEPRTGPSATYELTARLLTEPEAGHETEPNSDPEMAAEILINDPAFGYFGWNKDVDVWKLSVEGFTSTYSLDLDVTAVAGVTPTLTVFDRDHKPVAVRQGRKDMGLSVRNLVVAGSPDGKSGAPPDGDDDDGDDQEAPSRPDKTAAAGASSYYYAELRARRSNPEEAYRLEMKTRLLDVDEEVEPNDDAATALSLRDSPRVIVGQKSGHLTLGDTDHYRLGSVAEAVLLSVTVKPSGEVDLAIEVSVNGSTVALQDAGKAGKVESVVDVRIAAGSEAVIKISGQGSLGDEARYELDWAVDPAPALAPPAGGTDPPADDPAGLDDYEDE